MTFVRGILDVAQLGHADSPTGRTPRKAGETAHALQEESRAEADRIVEETKEATAKGGRRRVGQRAAHVEGEGTDRQDTQRGHPKGRRPQSKRRRPPRCPPRETRRACPSQGTTDRRRGRREGSRHRYRGERVPLPQACQPLRRDTRHAPGAARSVRPTGRVAQLAECGQSAVLAEGQPPSCLAAHLRPPSPARSHRTQPGRSTPGFAFRPGAVRAATRWTNTSAGWRSHETGLRAVSPRRRSSEDHCALLSHTARGRLSHCLEESVRRRGTR